MNTYTKLRSGEWGVRVEGTARRGDRVTVSRKDGQTRTETVRSVVWSGGGVTLCAIEARETPPRGTPAPARRSAPRKPAAPRGPQLVGERTELRSEYEASRSDRTPHRAVGEACYLKHGSERLAVVVVGYETATYVRAEDAEDMGHYGVRSGWYGTLYYRPATEEEAAALEQSPAEVARRERELRAAQARELEERIRETSVATDDRVPAGAVRVAGIGHQGLAGQHSVYLADAEVWRLVSSYDDVPRVSRTTDPRAVELATLLVGGAS